METYLKNVIYLLYKWEMILLSLLFRERLQYLLIYGGATLKWLWMNMCHQTLLEPLSKLSEALRMIKQNGDVPFFMESSTGIAGK